MDEGHDAAPGRFSVMEDECICCSACAWSGDHFGPNRAGTGYVCRRQPDDAEAVERCLEALEGCPVGAIRAQDPGTITV